MFDSYIGDIDHDISVLAMDKILYDNGFSVTDSEIHSDSEYNTFFEALLSMDGYIDEDESDETDFTVMVFRNDCLKRYLGLALKYGSINGLPNGNNFWIRRPNIIIRMFLFHRVKRLRIFMGRYLYDRSAKAKAVTPFPCLGY